MEESVDLHEEAGKENEQTLANLSPSQEATSKDDPETDSEYLVWKSERGRETRTGQDGGHQRAFELKGHASNNKSRCPVEFYKLFEVTVPKRC